MPNIDAIEELITERGGTFIEELRINNRIYVRFMCENGHESNKRSDCFNSWCQECLKNTIEDAHNLALRRGFKFLSESFTNCNAKYLWECSEGHTWEAKYGNIHTGKGCPECLMIPFSYYTDLVTQKGGVIITTEDEYENIRSKIKFTCKEGHECETTGASLRVNHWCAECQISLCERTCKKIFEYLFEKPFIKSRHLINTETLRGIELDGYNNELKIAFEYNGYQHYKKVSYWQTDKDLEDLKIRDKLKKELCKQTGINLIVIPYTVKYEDLYTHIVSMFPDNNFEETIDYDLLELGTYNQCRLNDVINAIKKYNGKLLTKIYINNTTKMDFVCENDHPFQSTWGLIQQGFFCKKCSDNELSSRVLPIIEEFCKKYHFKLGEYTRAKDILQWECTKCNKVIERNWDYLRQTEKSHYNCESDKSVPVPKIPKVIAKIEEFCTKYHFRLLSKYTKYTDILQWECTDCGVIIDRSWQVLNDSQATHYNCDNIIVMTKIEEFCTLNQTFI